LRGVGRPSRERGFHLSGLDPMTAYLHLVDTAGELDRPVVAIPRTIPGSIEASAGRGIERMRDKLLGG